MHSRKSLAPSRLKPRDLDSYAEMTLALAQSSMQHAIDDSGLDLNVISNRFCESFPKKFRRIFASRILGCLLDGDYNLTVKDMGRLFAICGFEVRFIRIPRLKPSRFKRQQLSKMLLSSTYGRQA